MSDPILFETVQSLGDAANPSHACCPTCKEIKPIADFTRRPTPLQKMVWGWDTKHDLKKKKCVGKDCNDCAKKRKARQRYTDYRTYDKTLRLSGLYEFLVPHPDGKRKDGELVYITERERMILAKKKQGKEAQKRGAITAMQNRYSSEYHTLQTDITREIDRAAKQAQVGLRITDESRPYLACYMDMLRWLKREIKAAYDTGKKPAPKPNYYINESTKLVQETQAMYHALPPEQRSAVARKYLKY